MSSRFLSAYQIVNELGLYGSVDAVSRGWKKGEIPEPKQFGNSYMWNLEELLAYIAERDARRTPKRGFEADARKRRKVVIMAEAQS